MFALTLTRRQLWLAMLCACLIVGQSQQSANAQGPALFNLTSAANVQPIRLYADNIATWTVDGKRFFLMRGKALVEQGLTSLRMSQALAWVDEEAQKKTNVYDLMVYAEQGVQFEQGNDRQTPVTALAHFSTRDAIKLGGAIAQQSQSNDPLVARAQAANAAASAPPSPPSPPALQQTSYEVRSPAVQPIPTTVPWAAPPLQQVQQQSTPAIAVPLAPGQLPPGTIPGAPKAAAPARKLTVRPRSSQDFKASRPYQLPTGESAYVVTGGVILTVSDPGQKVGMLDIEADQVVIWTNGNSQDLFNNMRQPQGHTTDHMEFYLAGNVELRTQNKKESQVLRADEVYYDVSRNAAIALHGDLEMRDPKSPLPIHFKSDEIDQINEKLFKAKEAFIYSSTLPSDPGLTVRVIDATVEKQSTVQRSIFGNEVISRVTGQPKVEEKDIFTGRNLLLNLETVPIFYFPYLRGDARDPFGPLERISFNASNAFGFHLLTAFDMYQLLGIDPIPGTRWRLNLDYMTRRGPSIGTDFDFAGKDLLGIDNKYDGVIKGTVMHDASPDVLGGGRGTSIFIDPLTSVPVDHPDWRGRFFTRLNVQELPNGFSFQSQISVLSDQNYLEQYFPLEYNTELNQETYAYLKQQNNQWAWTLLAEPNIRNFVTETAFLPKVDGYLLGQSFFDLFTYNAHASAAYSELRPTSDPAPAFEPTDQRVDTGRLDLWQELSLPFAAGPFKLVPYVTSDLAYYTQDLSGDNQGRLYGGGGLRGSIPFSRLYSEVQSDLFNVDGLYHKIVMSGNYYIAGSTVSYKELPQLDRLNDDASDQSLRDIFPIQQNINPQNGAFLRTSALFDPQNFAVRRLIFDKVDTLDDIQVAQFDFRQRLQTKRGIPGNQTIIDWMVLDVGFSVFPAAHRDNFNQTFGIIKYDWVWNVGDRTALTSNGWFDTEDQGPHVFNFGGQINRPDGTAFYLGYRQIDPLNSQAVIGSINYALSAKYAVTASTTYDFGVQNSTTSFLISRMGTDLEFSFGVFYSTTSKNFGVTFEVLPILSPQRNRPGIADMMARRS